MKLKPRIFIGSSTEGLDIAESVKAFFLNDYECFLWTDDVFKYNESFLETLLNAANLFDFGIMVFTKDDFTKSRDKKFNSPRDNVVFEYGLFLGRLGKDNAFIIQEKNVKLPTDLHGITLPTFEYKTKKKSCWGKEKTNDINNVLQKIKIHIDKKVKLGFLGLLPSTVLAIGYFDNFVKPVCESLSVDNQVVKSYNCESYEFKIIIPKDLDSDIKKKASMFYKEKGFSQIHIDSTTRQYPLYVAIENKNNIATLSDMPTTLSSLDKSIEMYLRKGHIGKTEEQQLLEDRELSNFEKVLCALIAENVDCCKYVRVEKEV